MRFTLVLLMLSLANAQKSEPTKTTFEGQAGLLLANGTIELTVLSSGSTFAQLRTLAAELEASTAE